MRIQGMHGSASGASREVREVEAKQTSVSHGDIRKAIEHALAAETGHSPSAKTVDVLTAHASLETASGARMFNYNFGGIKGAGPSGETARYKTHEVIEGKEVTIRDGFRAYGSLDEGAADYVRLMRGRFGAAVGAAERGDLDGFAHALKTSGYYTADESKYASALHALSGDAVGDRFEASKNVSFAMSNTNLGLPDSSQVERFMNALSHHRPHVEDDSED